MEEGQEPDNQTPSNNSSPDITGQPNGINSHSNGKPLEAGPQDERRDSHSNGESLDANQPPNQTSDDNQPPNQTSDDNDQSREANPQSHQGSSHQESDSLDITTQSNGNGSHTNGETPEAAREPKQSTSEGNDQSPETNLQSQQGSSHQKAISPGNRLASFVAITIRAQRIRWRKWRLDRKKTHSITIQVDENDGITPEEEKSGVEECDPFEIGEFIGQGRKLEFCGLSWAVMEESTRPKFNKSATLYEECTRGITNRLNGRRPRSWFVIAFISQGLVWTCLGMAFLFAFMTPTVGFGCWSGGVTLYGILSSITWIVHLVKKTPGKRTRNFCNFCNFLALGWLVAFTVMIVSILPHAKCDSNS